MEVSGISRKAKHRINEAILAKECRLVDEKGEQIGIVPLVEAQKRADAVSMDLVEVAPDAAPPVCKILDYGKMRFGESKKQSKGRKTHNAVLKEVRMRPKTEEHDFQVKLRNVIKFLTKGDKVQITVLFRGREMEHRDMGQRHMDRLALLLATDTEENPDPIAVVESEPKMNGRRMHMILAPQKAPITFLNHILYTTIVQRNF